MSPDAAASSAAATLGRETRHGPRRGAVSSLTLTAPCLLLEELPRLPACRLTDDAN